MLRVMLLLVAGVGGYIGGVLWPPRADFLRNAGLEKGVAEHSALESAPTRTGPSALGDSLPDSAVRLTPDQIATAGIKDICVTSGTLTHHLATPGTIVPDANNTARIAVKTTGTIAELRKGLGDRVSKGEVVALLDSREIADAKSEYLTARVSANLQKTLSERDRVLWEKRVSSEQQYLRTQANYDEMRVKVEAARRKLMFLGLATGEIDALPSLPTAHFERQEIRSPIAGRIVDRRVELGAAVGRDNLETELYSVVNLEQVWIDLAVSPDDLPLVREGQPVEVSTSATGDRGVGYIIFISPVLNTETRSARVVARLENPREVWRPGSFVSAQIAVAANPTKAMVPSAAVLKIAGHDVVFVKNSTGYEVRRVSIGGTDSGLVEIVSGLTAGEMVAAENVFTLKAELLKVQAQD